MKKLAFIATGVVAANVAANAVLFTIGTSGGTVSGLAFLAKQYFVPVTKNYTAMVDAAS